MYEGALDDCLVADRPLRATTEEEVASCDTAAMVTMGAEGGRECCLRW